MKDRELYIGFSASEKFEEINYELKSAVRKAIFATLEYENFPYPAEVSVTFCSPEHIRRLNAEYRKIDKETDVLSFPLYEACEFTYEECSAGAALGDIVISIPRAKVQAEELGHGFVREVCFLAIHSTLHLLGYDHERSERDDEIQCSIQREIINSMEFDEV